MKRMVLISVVCVLAGGCSSDKPLPPVVMPTPLVENRFAPDQANNYLRQAHVTEYQMGRYVDRSGVMREAHPVYRIEQPPAWNMHGVHTGDPAAALALSGQVRQASMTARTAQASVSGIQDSQLALRRQVSALREDIKKRDDNMKIMAENLKLLKEYLEKLEKRMGDR